MQDNSKYEAYDETYLKCYKTDLKAFCERAKEVLSSNKYLK